MSFQMFETFGGDPVQPAQSGFLSLTLSANTQMSWPIQFQNTNLNVANYMVVSPTANGFVLTLPPATDVSVGVATIVNNPTIYSFAIHKFDGTLLFNSTAGTAEYMILADNTTAGGTWYTHPFAVGGSSVTSINATSSSNNLVIGGVPIVSAGTITFALANDLLSLTSFAGVGITCHIAANTYALRNIVGTANQIGIVNSDGVAGDITISLAPNITGITSIAVGDMLLQTRTISTVNVNEDLILAPNGIGLTRIQGGGLRVESGLPVYFYATNNVNYTAFNSGAQAANISLTWPTVAPTAGQVLSYTGVGTALGWANVTTFGGPSTTGAIPRYTNTTGSLGNSTVLLDLLGNITAVNSIAVGHLLLGGTGGDLPNTIASTDANGNIYLTPNGLGGVVSGGPLSILSQNELFLFNPGNNFYTSLYSGNLGFNLSIQLPKNFSSFGSTLVAGNQFTQGSGLTNPFLTWAAMSSVPNLLRNGGFNVWQRGTSFTNATVYPNNNLQYCADGWKLLSNGNNIVNISQTQGPIANIVSVNTQGGGLSQNAWRFTGSVGNAKFGMLQIIDNFTTGGVIGQSLFFSFYTRSVGLNFVKAAILYWIGAADAPTTNPISAWNAQGTDPTLVANWNYLDFSRNIALTNTYLNVTYLLTGGGAVPAAATNLGIMIWCDQTNFAPGNTLDISCTLLTAGPNFSPFYPEISPYEMIRCKRWFQKDFPYSITPFTTLTSSSKGMVIVAPLGTAVNVPNNTDYGVLSYELELANIGVPTIVIYPYTNMASINTVSNNAGVDLAANTGIKSNTAILAAADGYRGIILKNTSGANAATTGFFLCHYTASVEF